jgi:hypothetical protein
MIKNQKILYLKIWHIINGKPVKAFIYQDHQAHIKVHMAAMQDPKIMQMIGQNPQAGAIQAAAMAHINEHVAFEYRKQLEEQLGVPLPKPRIVARASEQLLQKNQTEVAQQEAAAAAQDPLTQIQQRELAIKEQEAQAKAQKMQADTELDIARLELEKMKIDSQERIAGANLGAKAVMEEKQLKAKELMEGAKLGVEVVQKDKELQLKNRKD